MNVAIGCDPNAADLKKVLIDHIEQLGHTCQDYGSDDPIYANVAIQVGEAVAAENHDRGIVLCGTGVGVCIAASKVPGAYVAICQDPTQPSGQY
jgi:ribose 5-phosphate isomerase B